ncbi:hypothetical protein BDV95DRAFT_526908 [Massariosphaeria phaeospora]|uniref:Uncharacterized protein n=1 Tax=Massariosphaeria phaeospora TaxID=100035 RepID=A0A7C8I104_9PLEO|nr:hypothetical protein BDV95DRAFT_526908 [Massariosphaeria phaeospora]
MAPRIAVRFPWLPSSALDATFNTSHCVRAFATTAPALALGPQSPNYIEVPKPLQPTFPPKPNVKGHLPVPRDVFKTRSPHPKASDKFLRATTSDPKEVKVPGPYSRDVDYRLYKQRLADTRKQALREGVKELHERKTESDDKYRAQIQRMSAERRSLAMAPPRTVDVLTQTSVSKSIRDFLDNKLPSTSRSNITKARRLAYQKRMERQSATRKSHLHDLYTNARQFIVSEEQLDEAIEQAFGSEEAPMGWEAGLMVAGGYGASPWEHTMPEGVGDKLQKLKGGEGVGLASDRIKKVAEELTGGKM